MFGQNLNLKCDLHKDYIYGRPRPTVKTTELEMQDKTEERVAIENAKLNLFKVLPPLSVT